MIVRCVIALILFPSFFPLSFLFPIFSPELGGINDRQRQHRPEKYCPAVDRLFLFLFFSLSVVPISGLRRRNERRDMDTIMMDTDGSFFPFLVAGPSFVQTR